MHWRLGVWVGVWVCVMEHDVGHTTYLTMTWLSATSGALRFV